RLLQRSFDLVLEREPDLTLRFYDVLFSRHPEVRALFGRNSQAAQARMLTDALASVVEHLEDAPWLEEKLHALGAKHVDYGVTTGMYGWVGDALLTTLAAVAGPDWSDELAREWGAAYGAIVAMMHPRAPVSSKRAGAPVMT